MKSMISALAICLTFLDLFAGHRAEARELRVAAASDLQFAMVDLAKAYEAQHKDVTITPIFGSSGNFVAQIQAGAPFDLFFSADSSFPEALMKAGKVEGKLFPYANGKIALWVKNDSKLDLDKGLQVLTLDAAKKIAIANPVHAPYGRAAEEALKTSGLLSKIESKLVKGENISQTAQFIQSGAADIGIIAMSLARSPQLSKEGRFKAIDASLYTKLIQSGVILKSSANKKEAESFRDFVLSEKGRAVLGEFGLEAAQR